MGKGLFATVLSLLMINNPTCSTEQKILTQRPQRTQIQYKDRDANLFHFVILFGVKSVCIIIGEFCEWLKNPGRKQNIKMILCCFSVINGLFFSYTTHEGEFFILINHYLPYREHTGRRCCWGIFEGTI